MAEKRKLISPYLEWAVLTEFAYLRGDWFWVLFELDGPVDVFAGSVARSGLEQLVRIPSIYESAAPPSLRAADVTCCMAIATREALIALASGKVKRNDAARFATVLSSVRRVELGTPTTNLFGKIPLAEQPLLSAKPSRRTIIAIIDDGLAFAHERFRFRNGNSRVKYFWNQDDATNVGAPTGFGWGRELPDSEINQLLASCTHAGSVDEDEFYRLAGQKLVARRAKHGTHVMDIACGLDSRDVAPGDSCTPYIIGVQLPRWVTEETSGSFLTPNVYAAISYVLSRADRIAAAEGTGPIPVVVNLSYGTIAGPHDGTAQLEAAIDQLISARSAPLRVVMPAGNHYLARCHAFLKLPKASTTRQRIERLRWRVQPDNKAASFAELWLPAQTAAKSRAEIAIRITTPTNERSPWIAANQSWQWPTPGKPRFFATYDDPTGERPRILLAMAPTADLKKPPRTAPSGTWLIEVKNRREATTVDVWIQRGDTPFGYPLWGRQSRFEDTDYVRFDLAGRLEQDDKGVSPVRRESTINALATGQHTVVVGGFLRSDRRVSEYSGAGRLSTPGAVPSIRSPDVSAVADDSAALRNLLAAGTRSGSVVAMNGTSVAAPQATRLISELMIAQLACDRADVQRIAKTGDAQAPGPGSPLAVRIGAGRIDLSGRPNRR
ncbi:hypothetical protein [Tardiphaga sp.]|uniref:hypothetical protein n=1 Tax=Tardiphaga sp. TaxID=1926292 RepID=UPI00352B1BF3